MAGYIISLNSIEALENCILNGRYSTNFKEIRNDFWQVHHEGTFADYLGMNCGDNIYFFIKRKIYGIGELINIDTDCKYLNYPDADLPVEFLFSDMKQSMIINENEECIMNRCFCTFKPTPYFFNNGIDMDDVLASRPESFKMLRAFWKLSFIKIDDDENRALKDIILKKNEIALLEKSNCFLFDDNWHKSIKPKLGKNYKLTAKNIVKTCSDAPKLKHEMAIEAAIIDVIRNGYSSPFGKWNYISHQVVASPFKPIDYMDKMDVFGYRFIEGFTTISKYLVIEIKKDKADVESVNQVMKYVDWITQEYCYGDYSMVEAYITAFDFEENLVEYKNQIGVRNFMKDKRPAIAATWNSINLVKYKYDYETGMHFNVVE